MKMKVSILASIVFAIVAAGCQTASPPEADEPIYLSKGMSATEVRDLVGEPQSVRQTSENGETWVYEETAERTRWVDADTREVPYVDIVTGELKTRPEVVKNVETKRTTYVTELHFLDGILQGWNESVRETKDFQELE